MDYRVSWSPTALDDVDSIAEYISRDSPAYTRAVVNKILDIARKLEAFPNAGRIVPELSDEEIREQFVYSYRIIYRVQNNEVLVIAVVHGRRLLEPLLDQQRLKPSM
ncbi:MAG: type II toxin-antitoxin system RelE/ParE family toxin [Gammaproteobacteria bacterium]|nr:MAG: type II toxin-antitoxin system RelE/ParE family toxin [Gammaproteobacteria bacterium]